MIVNPKLAIVIIINTVLNCCKLELTFSDNHQNMIWQSYSYYGSNRRGHPLAHPLHQWKQHIMWAYSCFAYWPLDLDAVLRRHVSPQSWLTSHDMTAGFENWDALWFLYEIWSLHATCQSHINLYLWQRHKKTLLLKLYNNYLAHNNLPSLQRSM